MAVRACGATPPRGPRVAVALPLPRRARARARRATSPCAMLWLSTVCLCVRSPLCAFGGDSDLATPRRPAQTGAARGGRAHAGARPGPHMCHVGRRVERHGCRFLPSILIYFQILTVTRDCGLAYETIIHGDTLSPQTPKANITATFTADVWCVKCACR